MNILQKLFDNNERDIKRYRKIVEKVNAREPEFEALSDEQLRDKTQEFKDRVQEAVGDEAQYRNKKEVTEAYNKALDDILPEAFAACREASKRALGMRHFDVQLIGGMVQHDGRISELRTGEGKTLTSTLATYLNALAGKGVHVVTANDYLVKRDAVWMGPVYHALGLTVGILQGHSPETGDGGGTFIYDPEYEDPDPSYRHARTTYDRREAYACDVLYATSSELGFDYLRDNMAWTLDRMVQHRGHWFATIDECDSNLIDEARTPLIISGTAEKSSDLYYVFAKLVPALEKGEAKKDKYDTETDEKDYTVDEKQRNATYTEIGLEKIEQALRKAGYDIEDISAMENIQYMQHASAALKAFAVFELDKDYVVKTNQEGKPEVVIVDESTGRLMFGRRWSDGLHQAVEAKEGIKIENESETLATITIQNFFRLYAKLAGMTGTAKTEEDEFRKIYALDVVQVPTNRPMIRDDRADTIYKTEESKLRGIASQTLQLWCKGQPVLVGTRSIEMSERVSTRLTFQAIETLGAVLLLRAALEEKRKGLGDTYNTMSQLLNVKIDDLNVPKLEKLAKELNISIKMLESNVIGQLAAQLEIENKDRLKEAIEYGIPHNVLNAKYHEQEARIITEAGRKGAVTIATNMAGRGVDILLGGTHYKDESNDPKAADTSYRRGGKRPGIAHVVTGKDKTADPETMGPAGAGTISLTEESHDHAKEREEVKALGGLFILGTERHESRRIDNQLRGRSGRQGDPGASQFHVSLEDFLWRVFGDRNSQGVNAMLMKGWEEDQSVDTPFLSKMIERAQKKVEQYNFDARKNVLEYDDVMNVQREVIYRERRKILEGEDLKDTLLDHLHNTVDSIVNMHCPEGIPEEEWDRSKIFTDLSEQFPMPNYISEEEVNTLPKAELLEKLHIAADAAYEDKESEVGPDLMREIERHVVRQGIDQAWIQHLNNMDYLREGIGLRGYGQVDPLVAYKKEALELFEQMQSGIMSDAARNIFLAQLQADSPMEQDLYSLLGEDGEPMEVEGMDDMRAQTFEEVNQLMAAVAEAEAKRQAEFEQAQAVAANEAAEAGANAPTEASTEADSGLLGGMKVARRRKKDE
ncbi:MAG: preprotein translocase subunit SecA [Armatimonas sp.]